MTFQTTSYSQLESILDRWFEVRILSTEVQKFKSREVYSENDCFYLERRYMHLFYGLRDKLYDCIPELSEEIEANMLLMNRDQQDIIYLNKLAAIYERIADYLENQYEEELNQLIGIRFNIEPPGKPVPRGYDVQGLSYRKIVEAGFDPYWDDYHQQEHNRIESTNEEPIPIKLIRQIVSLFSYVARIIYQEITQSVAYKNHPERIRITVPVLPIETAPAEDDKKLTAVQKLLLVRLLQATELFPQKLTNTDDAPELRAIALLTGMSYQTDIKGGTGANIKVNQLLDDRTRSKMTAAQAKPKLQDLDKVENVARLLNVDAVLSLIEKYRKDLNQIINNR